MAKKKNIHYVDNEKFYQAILEYKAQCKVALEQGKEKPRISDYIGSCIYKIAQGLATKPNFNNYTFVEEMIGDAVENSILYFDDYNPDYKKDEPGYKPNPFAYFTRVAYWAFLRRINTEEKNRCTTYKHFQESIGLMHDADLFTDEDGNNKVNPHQLYANLNEAIAKFEEKEEAKRAKKKAQKKNLREFYVEE
jgi:hypothetical protein